MAAGTPMTRDRRLVWVLAGALVLVVLVLVTALTRPGEADSAPVPGPSSSASAPAEEAGSTLPDLSRRIEGDMAAIGSVDAPVVLVEFADYRCPFCGVYARETLPVLIEEYVDQGLLRIEWRDLPLFGQQSFAAAVATRAAGAQGLFWEYSAAVFAYPGSGHQDLPRERLLEIAGEVGVPDLATFEAALVDPALATLVTDDMQEAQNLGVQSTPTFAVGGTPLVGAQPVAAFRAAIDAELERVAP